MKQKITDGLKKFLETTFKQLIWWILINSTIWVYLSYILAFLGREDIAEVLSKTVVAEIIAAIAVYAFKTLGENIFKYNDFSGVKKKTNDNTRKRDF